MSTKIYQSKSHLPIRAHNQFASLDAKFPNGNNSTAHTFLTSDTEPDASRFSLNYHLSNSSHKHFGQKQK